MALSFSLPTSSIGFTPDTSGIEALAQQNLAAGQAFANSSYEPKHQVERYEIRKENWYQALPYGFRRFTRSGLMQSIYLPISPENITIVTHYATNVITTLYGTVEQHSEQRYFDITIEGTTGMAPTYPDTFTTGGTAEKSYRASFHVTDKNWGSASAGGFFASTLGRYNRIANKAQDLISPQVNETGINLYNTGYAAFHRLYKFFQEYKIDTAGLEATKQRKKGKHPLTFLNYKDNNQYQCALTGFTLKKSANDPMMYRYSIVLRAYNLAPLSMPTVGQSYKDRLRALGLDGVKGSSILGDIKKTVGGAKDILGAAAGGLGGLGG